MKAGRWMCGFLSVAAAAMAQTAPESGKKLSARELFYAEAAPSAPVKTPEAKPARKPAAKPAAPARPAAAAEAVTAAPKAGPPLNVPARTSGQVARMPVGAAIVPAAYSPEKPLGLRYSFLRNPGGDQYREVDADTVFHSGDRIRVSVECNDEGYLYIAMKGTSGSWKVLFPSAEIEGGSNRVTSGRQYTIPPAPGRFAFDEQAGEEHLFIVLARRPEPSLEQLIYSLGSSTPAPAAEEAKEPPKHLLMASLTPMDDALVGRLRNQVLARDLVFEKVDEATPGEKKEKAVYVVNRTGSPESRLVADVTLKHQ
ncbi:MAG: DUF4384 domain-containing protein [Bryobacteraceae bacterium]